jgi:S1-C subfamily serine protease
MSDAQTGAISVARGVVKAAAIGAGAVGTLICLMSLVGLVIADGWVRVGVALVVMVGVPALLADRLLPDDDPAKAKGLPGDVFAVTWLGFTVVFSILLGGVTRGALTKEGDRLTASGMQLLGRAAYLMAGVDAHATDGPLPARSASASAAPGESVVPPTGSVAREPEAAPDSGPPKKPANPDDLTPAELFKKLAPAVVTIAIKAAGGMEGGGTGFLIDKEGTIVTNQHVVSSAQSLNIRFMSGATFEEVELLVEDAAQDLALLRVKLSKPTEGDPVTVDPVSLGNSDKVEVGERAIAIGNPLGLEHTLTDGIVSARRIYEGRQWIQMSVPISPGNSGGPLFDMHGTVIGITTARVGSIFAQNLNLAVPVNALKQLVKSEYPGRHKIGKGSKSSTW